MYNGFGFCVRGTISYGFVRKNKKSEHWLYHEGLQALFFAVKIHHHHLLKVAIVVELVVVGDFDGGPVIFCLGFGT